MPTFKDFYFDSSDGVHKIHTQICLPDGEPKAIVQVIHGIIEHIKPYAPYFEQLAENGYIVVGTDHLGHGRSFQLPEDKGYVADKDGWDYLVRDEEILRQAMKVQYPDLKQVAFGFSMGSFMLRTHLIRFPGGFDAAIVGGTGNQGKLLVKSGLFAANLVVGIMGPRHRSKLLNTLAFGNYTKIYNAPKTEFDWITRDEVELKKYLDDPLCGFLPTCSLFRDMMFGINLITNPKNIALMCKETPVVFMSGDMDPVGDCAKGVIKAYELFKEAGMKDVSMKIYHDDRHAIIAELNRAEVVKDMLDWIAAKI